MGQNGGPLQGGHMVYISGATMTVDPFFKYLKLSRRAVKSHADAISRPDRAISRRGMRYRDTQKKTISRRASDLAAWSAISWRSHGVTRGLQRVSLRGVAMSRLAEAIPRPSTQCHGYQKAIPRRGKNYFLFLLKKHKKHNRQV